MGAVRYDPAADSFHIGGVGGTGASSVSQAMGDGTNYPGAADANWFQSGGYTPAGFYTQVYLGASIAPHASAIPAGKDIIGCEVGCLAATYSNFGSIITIVNFAHNSGTVVAERTYSDAAPAWSRTVAGSNFYVAAADVPAFLASASFIVTQLVPAGGNARVDYFSVYVAFTVGVALEASIPVAINGPGEVSERHIGGTFPSVVI